MLHPHCAVGPKERNDYVMWFATVHAGVVPECESQVEAQPHATGDWPAATGGGKHQQHHPRGAPLCGLRLSHPGRQQQPAALRRDSPSPPSRPDNADPQLRRPVLATPITAPGVRYSSYG
jgi:hypothetical protein